MFGMNIKQEGIEVQGDQVSPAASVVHMLCPNYQGRRMRSPTGHMSGVGSWSCCMTPMPAQLQQKTSRSLTRTPLLAVTSISSRRFGEDARSSTSSLVKVARTSCFCTLLAVMDASTTGKLVGDDMVIVGTDADSLGRVMNDPRAREKLRMTSFDLPAHGRSFPVSAG